MKTISKIAALCMAAVMVLAMSVTVFADPAASLVITGDQIPGKQITAIQMFDASWVDVNEDGKIDSNDTVSYTLKSAWEGFFTDAMLTGVSGANRSEKAFNYLKDMQNDSAALNAFADSAAAYARNNAASLSSLTTTQTAGSSATTVTMTGLTPGYYLVLPEGGSTSETRGTDAILVNIPSAKSVALNLKSVYPTIEKTVDNGKKETSAQIGDTVTFKLESEVPEMSDYSTYQFRFVDTLSSGLQFDSSSLAITIGGKPAKASDYTVTTSGNVITIAFANLKTAKTVEGNEEAAISAGDAIVVTYDALVTENAVVNSTGNPNEAKVVYSNDPTSSGTGESLPSEATVYTYSIEVHKYHDSDIAANRLSGAVFSLKASNNANAADIPLIRINDNTYRLAKANESGSVTSFTTPSNGLVTIRGLEEGTYYLFETTAPTGYNKLTSPVTVTIAPKTTTSGNDTVIDYSIPQYSINSGTASDSSVVPVENNSGSMLPSTGGMGTVMLTAFGVLIVMLGVMLRSKKRGYNA